MISGREAEDEYERAVGAWPVLADEWFPAPAEEAAQGERNDHDVVELTGEGDEVRHEVEGEREITRERNEQRLLPARNARVDEQSAAEDHAVWDDARRSRVCQP